MEVDDDELEEGLSDPASILQQCCIFCVKNGFAKCEKTGVQGACAMCGLGKVRCSLKDQVNEYWKSISKIGRRSQSRSLSRAPSEQKTPHVCFSKISVFLYTHIEYL